MAPCFGAVAGATVILIIDPPKKGPNLTPVTPPVTDGNGNYSFNFRTSKRTGNGTYDVTASTVVGGDSASDATSFFVAK